MALAEIAKDLKGSQAKESEPVDDAPAPDEVPESPPTTYAAGDRVRSRDETRPAGEITEVMDDEAVAYRVRGADGREYMSTGLELDRDDADEMDSDEAAAKVRAPDALCVAAGVRRGSTVGEVAAAMEAAADRTAKAEEQVKRLELKSAGCKGDLIGLVAGDTVQQDGEEDWDAAIARAQRAYPSAFGSDEELVVGDLVDPDTEPVKDEEPAPADVDGPSTPAPDGAHGSLRRIPKGAQGVKVRGLIDGQVVR
jgi:hypothetical protein